ncbi:MAG: prepilin peptidase [Anaerolineales bacterium]
MLLLLKQVFLISLGVMIGALVNYLADQLPLKKRLSYPHCSHCFKLLEPAMWFASISFIVGSCKCGNKISLRSILLEPFFAILLPLIDGFTPTNPHFVITTLLLACFFLIIVIDIEHKLILNSAIIPTAFIALAYSMQTNNQDILIILASGIAGYLLMLLVFYGGKLYWKLSLKNKGLSSDFVVFGMGDVKLGGLIGLATGWSGLPQAIAVSFISSGIVAIAIRISNKYKPFTMLPFSPFLILGALIVLFLA